MAVEQKILAYRSERDALNYLIVQSVGHYEKNRKASTRETGLRVSLSSVDDLDKVRFVQTYKKWNPKSEEARKLPHLNTMRYGRPTKKTDQRSGRRFYSQESQFEIYWSPDIDIINAAFELIKDDEFKIRLPRSPDLDSILKAHSANPDSAVRLADWPPPRRRIKIF